MEISESYDTPVIVRLTTRGAHSQSIVELGKRSEIMLKPYEKNIRKYVMTPANAKVRHLVVEERMNKLEKDIKTLGLYQKEACESKIGIITSGINYEYVKESKVEANILKLDMINPLPKALPIRPPVLCPGCPHRGLYTVLTKLKLTVMGDIGCYTLGSSAPHGAMDTCICMGASIGMAHGMEKARGVEANQKTVGIIGDSTFIHSGITGLTNIVYNKGLSTIIIADNSTTGMTGHQDHPATGKTLKGEISAVLDIPNLCKAIGVKNVSVVDAYDMKAIETALKEEIIKPEPSVIITKAPCKLLIKEKWETYTVCEGDCTNCGLCSKLGCPAIQKEEHYTTINDALCAGCGLCESMCKKGAIGKGDKQ